ncbi:MAG: UvrB/UvrC motif-containing protein [Planctomycetota bacterium]
MKKKCDQCDRPATHHAIEIVAGEKIETHLCDYHAAESGLSVKAGHTPINQLLTNFVKVHSGAQKQEDQETSEDACEDCGTTFAAFRESSLLGCPTCYTTFDERLSPLIARAHEGARRHVGKAPRRAGVGHRRQLQLTRMRRRLDEAVQAEDYELAARLRDDIGQLEQETA